MSLRGLVAMGRALCMFCALIVANATLAADQDYLRSGHPGEPDSLDPHLAVSAPAIVVTNDLFEGLYTLDARGQAVLGAAATVSPLPNALGPGFEFRLRPGLRWSDGKPLTAHDFEYSLKRLADPQTASTLLASYVDLIAGGREVLAGRAAPDTLGVRALDDQRLQLRLTYSAAYLPVVLSFPAFAPVPRHVIERHGRSWTRPGNHVSNGAFMLESWQPNNFVRVKRNPNFHAAVTVRLAGVVYRPIVDQNSSYRLFLSGELDAITNFPPERLDWLRANRPRELRLAPSLGHTVYLFNFRREKFRDRRVRQALALAIDRDIITRKIVRTGDQPAYGLVPAGLPNYLSPLAPKPATQSARSALARQLLAAAGYTAAKPLSLELLYHTSEEHKNVALAAVSMWRSVGVQAELRNAERQVVEVATRNGDFDMVRAAWFAAYPDPNGLFNFLRAGSAANGAAYNNAAFDALVERAERTADARQRATLQRQAEQLLIDDQAFVPLYYLVGRRLVATRVLGWRDDNPTSLRPARYLRLATANLAN